MAEACVVTRGDSWIKFAWVSTTGGAVSKAVMLPRCILNRLVTNPGTAPTADYDITLIGPDGEDVLQGAGTDRHTTATEQAEIQASGGTPPVVEGHHVFTIAAAGDTKDGVARIHLEKR